MKLPVILFAGSNVSILSMRSMANGWTCGNTLANCCRGCRGSWWIYLLASSLLTNPRSDSEGVPRSWEKVKESMSIHLISSILKIKHHNPNVCSLGIKRLSHYSDTFTRLKSLVIQLNVELTIGIFLSLLNPNQRQKILNKMALD